MQTNHTRMARQHRKYLWKMLPKHSINAKKLQQITVEWQGNLEISFVNASQTFRQRKWKSHRKFENKRYLLKE